MNGYTVNEQGLMNNFAVEPKMYVQEQSRTGFTQYAEKLNGRLAMLGFVSMLVMEALTGQGLISWLSNL
ncbi:chlorophyll a/b-binding protein [Oxynema aestuarii]|uniref:High light inducible protein n=1 Tax=Oxynema aestuarii AP17 TaxID=2064643 RepID=A0A6H1U1T1_9CYAN|nr:chlorophyll a/b-binding protein [Oxynema aestuarii]QIZ72794.1 high light inducible protein [Oxynema aestuarii AP17]